MINFYKTIDNSVKRIDQPEQGCWISVVEPTKEEIRILIEDFKIDSGFVRSSLDEEEYSRIEIEDDQTLLIVDTAVTETQVENTILYFTMPIGIIITNKYVFTISSKENHVISELQSGVIKNLYTHYRTQFVLKLLLGVATRFLQSLKQIDKISYSLEMQLHKSMKNKELIQLLGLEKSLVYFSTSLKANEITLEKILRGRALKLYDEDQELLEDVLIEIKQAIEMANIYSSILSGMMDAFASVISNNVGLVMKHLTKITILLSIPTIIYSFYGMNVTSLPFPNIYFSTALSLFVTGVVAFFLLKKDKD